MNDLFQSACPCCGQSIPDQQETPFDAFWASIPKGKKNGSKPMAEKAWAKLSPQDRKLAQERVGIFLGLTKEERIGASSMHISTFLNQRCFEEEVLQGKQARINAPKVDPLTRAENDIKSAKPYLCTNITQVTVRQLIAAGRVTEDECRKVGL